MFVLISNPFYVSFLVNHLPIISEDSLSSSTNNNNNSNTTSANNVNSANSPNTNTKQSHANKQRLISPRRQKPNTTNQQSPTILTPNFANMQQSPNSTNVTVNQQQQHQHQQQQQQSQIFNLAQFLNNNNNSSNGNNTSILTSTDMSNLLLNLNNGQQLQQHQPSQHMANIEMDSNQQQQQIICIQPDGNIVFQTVHQPFQQQQQQQQIMQQENQQTNSPLNSGTKQTASAIRKRKANTIAANLTSNDSSLVGEEPTPKATRKNHKVANLLSSSENKQKIDQMNTQQLDLQKILQFQIQPEQIQQQQQWILINNNSNTLSQIGDSVQAILSPSVTNTNTPGSEANAKKGKAKSAKEKSKPPKKSSAKSKANATDTASTLDAKKSDAVLDEASELMNLYKSIGNNDTSMTSNGTENKDEEEDEDDDEGEEEEDGDGERQGDSTIVVATEYGVKRRRRACECPNCIKYAVFFFSFVSLIWLTDRVSKTLRRKIDALSRPNKRVYVRITYLKN